MTLANFLSIFYDYGFEKEQSTHIRLFFVMHSVDQEKLYGLIIKGEKKLFRHFFYHSFTVEIDKNQLIFSHFC